MKKIIFVLFTFVALKANSQSTLYIRCNDTLEFKTVEYFIRFGLANVDSKQAEIMERWCFCMQDTTTGYYYCKIPTVDAPIQGLLSRKQLVEKYYTDKLNDDENNPEYVQNFVRLAFIILNLEKVDKRYLKEIKLDLIK